jgi:hypothetical protein
MAKKKKDRARGKAASAAELKGAQPCRICGKQPKDCGYTSARIRIHDWLCREDRRALSAKRRKGKVAKPAKRGGKPKTEAAPKPKAAPRPKPPLKPDVSKSEGGAPRSMIAAPAEAAS